MGKQEGVAQKGWVWAIPCWNSRYNRSENHPIAVYGGQAVSEADAAPDAPLVEPLTRREREILGLLSQGLTAPEIAEQLTLAVSSVKWHIQHVYDKLGVSGKRQALNRAQALGLLESPASVSPTQPSPALAPPLAAARSATQPAAAPRHNLPAQVTRFFGRAEEIEQVRQRLSEWRLVTLTGSGGVGKTRLALSVAQAALDEYADGVWFVELAALADPALVAQQAAVALSVHDDPGRPVLAALTAFLRPRQLLVVLDNCEHLLEACARLADGLLRACPRLTLLASSREPLGISGEAVFRVPSLPFPDPAQLPPLERLGDYAALNLFVDRARAVVPAYRLAAHNAIALARICQRLDGIPLALELAAARTNLLSADQLAERLAEAFDLLSSDSRTALSRHRALRATIDWSYQLLNPAEQVVLQRLAVFAGGCTLEAAEAVCAGEGLAAGRAISANTIIDSLASLVAKSMVIADRQPGAGARYHLLEMVRQYAAEKLNEAGETQPVHARQRDYYVAFIETNVPKLESAERLLWTQRLTAERDNIRQALEYSFSDESQPDIGPKLLHDFGPFQFAYQENLDWHLRAVAWCEHHPSVSPAVYAQILGHTTGPVALNDPPGALRLAQKAVEICRGLGASGQESLMWRLFELAGTYLRDLSQPEAAQPIFAEAEAMLPTVAAACYSPETYQRVRSSLADMKAELALGLGQYPAAIALGRESIRLREPSGDRWSNIGPLFTIGMASLQLGEYDQARDDFLVVLDLIEEFGDWRKSAALRWLAMVDWQEGYLERAGSYCRESLREAVLIPEYNVIAGCLGVSAGIAAKAGQPLRAATLSGASAALWKKQGRIPWEDSTLDTLLPGWQAGPEAAALTQAYDAGQALSADEAMAYALGEDIK